MITSKRLFAHCALVSTCLLTLLTSVFATPYYATPSGAGTMTGGSWANAYSQAQLATAVAALTPGDILYLGSGTYTNPSFLLSSSGTSGSPKSIIGVDTGSGLPLMQGNWNETTPAASGGSAYCIRFSTIEDGHVAYWVVKDLRISRYLQAVTANSIASYSNLTLDNIDADTVRDGIAMINWTNCVVKNCDIIRHTKKGFRLAGAVNNTSFENCTADANGGNDAFPTEAYPTGFFSDSSSGNHDNTFTDCTAKNNRMSSQPSAYWNGDGFSTEGNNYNYTYLRCRSFDNHDGGFDDKARSANYRDCVALGNKRGFRIWGSNGVMTNCLSAYNASWGDAYAAHGLWVSAGDSVSVSQSTFFNATDEQVYAEAGAQVALNDSILSVDGVFASGAMTNTGVLLNRTIRYTPSTGPDANPNYVAPSRTWTGSPANAFDSQTYTSPERGYDQASGTPNVAPIMTITAGPYISGMTPLTVNFTASATDSDGTIASYAWTFGDGGSSTAQNPSHTYTTVGTFTAECVATDNSGAVTVRRVAIQVIAANAGPSHYITPTGAGAHNGSNWANAYGETELQAVFNSISSGHTVNLGSGTYSLGGTVTMTKSGTSSAPVVVQGVDTGAGLPLFDGTFDNHNNASTSFLSFGTGAMSYLTVKNLSFIEHGWVIDMPKIGTTDTLRDHITFENLSFDSVEDAIRIRNSNNVLVRNCHVIRYTKKAFRIGDYSSFVTFQNCSADCTGGNLDYWAKNTPNGFFCEDETGSLPIIHDITFIDCVARNNGYNQSSGDYWNGDGFSTERGHYNILRIRCQSYDNNDGGFDDKADNLTMIDCVAAGNFRQYRLWGTTGVVLQNCLGANGVEGAATGGSGGTGGPGLVWLRQNAQVTIRNSTFDSGGSIYLEPGAALTIEDSIVSQNDNSTIFFTGGTVTNNNTATYSLATGTNPQYVARSDTWRGSPVNAYDNATWGTGKGYSSTWTANAISVNISDGTTNSLAATDVVGAVPALNWNNAASSSGLTNLVDSLGAATTADVTFGNTNYGYANNTGTLAAPMDDDAKMMRGQRGHSNNSTMSATVAQVPTEYATYDVYVYWGGRTPLESVPATMTVNLQLWNGTAWVTSETKCIRDDNRVWDASYNESTAPNTTAAVDGNEFVVFRGLTDRTFRISATCGVRTGISGFQIVPR